MLRRAYMNETADGNDDEKEILCDGAFLFLFPFILSHLIPFFIAEKRLLPFEC